METVDVTVINPYSFGPANPRTNFNSRLWFVSGPVKCTSAGNGHIVVSLRDGTAMPHFGAQSTIAC